MAIIGTFPTSLANGTLEDATQVMTLFNWIQSQTNGNACPATTGSSILKGNGAGGTATASPGVDYVIPSGAIGTLNWGGTSTGSANAQLLTPATAITAYAAGQSFDFYAGFTNTGALQINVSSQGLVNVYKKSSGGLTALVANDVVAGNAYRVTYDGTQFELINIRPYSQGAAIASAATINLDTATGDYVHITGSTGPITTITLAQGEQRTVTFDSTPTLTNGASLILPGGANITVVAGSCAIFRGEASGVVRCVSYTSNVTAPGALVAVTAYTAGATFTKNASTRTIWVEVMGGGGGGGGSGAASALNAGGGGGQGEMTRAFISSPSASYTVTIGSGGTSGANTGSTGGTGGTSSFGAGITAIGGSGGAGDNGATGNVGGAGGTGGVGATIAIAGQGGGNGVPAPGEGAGGIGGGQGGGRGNAGASVNGVAGVRGGGGSGAAGTSGTGGAGGAGYVIVWEYS